MSAPEIDKEENYRTYLHQHGELSKLLQEGARSFDKWLLTLASGAFAFTLHYASEMAKPPLVDGGFLIASWVFFAGSILATLFSFLTSQWACAEEIEIIGAVFVDQKKAPPNYWSKITGRLNSVSFMTLWLALCLFGWFAWVNLPAKEETKDDQRIEETGIRTDIDDVPGRNTRGSHT